MYYALIGLIGLMVLVIENQDILFNVGGIVTRRAWKIYRGFLYAALFYYVTDMCWGLIESRKLKALLFIDTSVYFIAMAAGILLWTKFVITYLEEKNRFGSLLFCMGYILSITISLLVLVNIFLPVLFEVDGACVYKPYSFRYVALIGQIAMLILISLHAFTAIIQHRCNRKREQRYMAIGYAGLVMAAFLIAQIWYPYLPLYAMAYLFGTVIVRNFMIRYERDEYREDLANAQKKATIDAMTGVGNNRAFIDAEEEIDEAIAAGTIGDLAVVVLDVNNLKQVNDTEGHQAGDKLICDACKIISNTFRNSPVFRIGGDEFAVIVQGDDYTCIDSLMKLIAAHNAQAIITGGIVIACGMSKIRKDDVRIATIIGRADQRMYENKKELKSL